MPTPCRYDIVLELLHSHKHFGLLGASVEYISNFSSVHVRKEKVKFVLDCRHAAEVSIPVSTALDFPNSLQGPCAVVVSIYPVNGSECISVLAVAARAKSGRASETLCEGLLGPQWPRNQTKQMS